MAILFAMNPVGSDTNKNKRDLYKLKKSKTTFLDVPLP